jgi:aminomethyltransferase
MKQTALYQTHIQLGARMVPFVGWEMPIVYSSINNEHKAVRERAGIFDVSHMGDQIIHGSGASDFIRRLLPFDFTTLSPGQAFYSHFLNENGNIIDDTIVLRLESERYLLIPNASTTEIILDHIRAMVPSNVVLEDHSNEMQCIALQGPNAPAILSDVLSKDVSSLPFFSFIENDYQHTKTKEMERIIISATGYTGEKGFEIISSRRSSVDIWNRLMTSGREYGIEPCGLGSRDTLRLEKGYLLSGTDFSFNRTPLETGHDWTINWDHDFVGKQALLDQKRENSYEQFTGIIMSEKGIPRTGMKILSGDTPIGTITSGTFSPTLKKGIGLGYVNSEFLLDGTEVQIKIRNSYHKAIIKKPPFV